MGACGLIVNSVDSCGDVYSFMILFILFYFILLLLRWTHFFLLFVLVLLDLVSDSLA